MMLRARFDESPVVSRVPFFRVPFFLTFLLVSKSPYKVIRYIHRLLESVSRSFGQSRESYHSAFLEEVFFSSNHSEIGSSIISFNK